MAQGCRRWAFTLLWEGYLYIKQSSQASTSWNNTSNVGLLEFHATYIRLGFILPSHFIYASNIKQTPYTTRNHGRSTPLSFQSSCKSTRKWSRFFLFYNIISFSEPFKLSIVAPSEHIGVLGIIIQSPESSQLWGERIQPPINDSVIVPHCRRAHYLHSQKRPSVDCTTGKGSSHDDL